MEIEWTEVEMADSYEVTYNNLETEHVKTLTGIKVVIWATDNWVGRAPAKSRLVQ